MLQNRGTCGGYTTPQSVQTPTPAGFLCDLGQQPRRGCDYCDQVYQYPGGPLNHCAQDVCIPPDPFVVAQGTVLEHVSCAALLLCCMHGPGQEIKAVQ